MTALLLATLAWTMPTMHAAPNSCEPGTVPLTAPIRWTAWAQVQSQTWRDSGAVMLRDPLAWDRLWPRVRVEGEPVTLMSGVAAPGKAMRVPLFSLPSGAYVYVTTRTDSGSCRGNNVRWK